MIKKIDYIRSMAVFQDYNWDNVFAKNKTFSHINIFYGRNYSGKTTLSRIVRALETGGISKNYDNPQFQVTWENGNTSTSDNLTGHNETIRVFNEDFVRENLGFLMDTSNPNGTIEPFAVLGAENLRIEEEIKTIQDELGCSENGKETGLYLELKSSKKEYEDISIEHKKQVNSLEEKKKKCANDNNGGIRYQAHLYGDQNYDVRKLFIDIQTVLDSDYKPLNQKVGEKQELERCISEATKQRISMVNFTSLEFQSLCQQAKELVERKIGVSEKILELIRNHELNEWVKQGCPLHSKRTTCAFCGQAITSIRRDVLHRHFDDETEKLEEELEQIVAEIKEFQVTIQRGFIEQKDCFYSKYQADVEKLRTEYSTESDRYLHSIELLLNQLNQRRQAITEDFSFVCPEDFTTNINNILSRYEKLCRQSNEYTERIDEEKQQARKRLRLDVVRTFCDTIGYEELRDTITQLDESRNKAEGKVTEIQNQINDKNAQIENLRRQLDDESKGAEEVNNYLNHVLGNPFLSLVAIPNGQKQVRFEIQRGGNMAYNLSEGECSLIAFCYFMAKLKDINTKDKKPIVWIDDPISSLDGNHIFFVYALIKGEIIDNDNFTQLFLSTHNLLFLQYFQRENAQRYFIERATDFSILRSMPKYLEKYITEFIYLFHQIYICATASETNDQNYGAFYNFGNNARKFLEIYRFYKFLDSSDSKHQMETLFGSKICALFVDRINNECSHWKSSLERGTVVSSVSPEIKNVAQCILESIKKADEEQYRSFLKSIDVQESEEDQIS